MIIFLVIELIDVDVDDVFLFLFKRTNVLRTHNNKFNVFFLSPKPNNHAHQMYVYK